MGDTGSADFQFSQFAPTLNSAAAALVAGDLYVRKALAGGGLDVDLSSYNSTSGLFVSKQAPIHASDDLASATLMQRVICWLAQLTTQLAV